MKKNVVMLVGLCVPFAHGIEPENKLKHKQWSVIVDGTKINLTKAYLCDAYNTMKVDVRIVGYNQQKLLQSNIFDVKEQEIGHSYYRGNTNCRIYSAENSADDSLQKKVVYKESLKEKQVYAFTEPYLFISEDKRSVYYVSRKKIIPECIGAHPIMRSICKKVSDADKRIMGTRNYEDEAGTYLLYEFCGDKAIGEASKDLKKCYKEIFKQISVPNAGASIALPALGINISDAPSIAVASILKYIKNSKVKYGRIEVILEEDADFILYKLSLMKHCGLLKSMLMFWFAHHKDSKSMVALLPIELIRSIAQLSYDIEG